MKTVLLIALFIIVAPLFIGIMAGRSGKSDSDSAASIMMIGFLILLIIYIVFIDKESEKTADKPSSSSSAPVHRDTDVLCMNDEHEETVKQPAVNEVLPCDPSSELSHPINQFDF